MNLWQNPSIAFPLKRASVFHGLRSCCPMTIFGVIVSVIVDAIKHQTGRTIAHVDVKVFKDKPAGANFNSTRAVIFEAFHVGISAARQHGSPNAIYFGASHSMCKSRFGVVSATAARQGVSSGQIRHWSYDNLLSAVALTLPTSPPAVLRWMQCDKAAKTSTGKFNRMCHA